MRPAIATWTVFLWLNGIYSFSFSPRFCYRPESRPHRHSWWAKTPRMFPHTQGPRPRFVQPKSELGFFWLTNSFDKNNRFFHTRIISVNIYFRAICDRNLRLKDWWLPRITCFVKYLRTIQPLRVPTVHPNIASWVGEIKLQLNHNMQLRLGGLNQSQLFHRFRLRYSHNRSVGMIDFYIILFSV
jgi:hypothetical protein